MPTNKPTVKLLGLNGNAFVILAACMTAARKAGWSADQVAEFRRDATSGDYDQLLRACQDHFDVK